MPDVSLVSGPRWPRPRRERAILSLRKPQKLLFRELTLLGNYDILTLYEYTAWAVRSAACPEAACERLTPIPGDRIGERGKLG